MRFETERLLMREWQQKDVDDLYEGLNNVNVAKNLLIPFPYTRQDAENFIAKRLKEQKEGIYYFAVELKETGKVIGGTNILLDENKIATGGFWLNEEFHGKGYGTEFFKARAIYCFETLKAEKLNNGYLEGNEASWAIQKKLGYKIVGEQQTYCPTRGEETKETLTCLTKQEREIKIYAERAVEEVLK